MSEVARQGGLRESSGRTALPTAARAAHLVDPYRSPDRKGGRGPWSTDAPEGRGMTMAGRDARSTTRYFVRQIRIA